MVNTEQIGSRLVRPLANGKKAVTENLGRGKTLTKVLDNEGNTLYERLKVISEPQKVGNKTVIHTDRVLQINGCIEKSSVDRVYDSEKYLGSREIMKGSAGCTKKIEYRPCDSDSKGQRTSFYNDAGLRTRESVCFDFQISHISADRTYVQNRYGVRSRAFNNKGLMVPNAPGPWEGMTMLQMRKTLQESHPDLRYTNWPGMESLDARVEEKATNLFNCLG